MKLGEQSTDPVRVWRELPISARREISLALWEHGKSGLIDWAAEALGKRFHSREQTVKHWPKEKRIEHLASTEHLNRVLVEDMMRTYFFARHKPMMARFLDSVGIEHEDCSITNDHDAPSKESLRKGISRLLLDFPREQIELYLRILLNQAPTWSELNDIDVGEIEPAQDVVYQETPMTHSENSSLSSTASEQQVHPSKLVELRRDLKAIRESFEAAAETFESEGRQLALGVLPENSLEQTLSDLRAKHTVLSKALLHLAGNTGIDPQSKPLKSFAEFEELMDRIEHAQKAREDRDRQLQEVVSILDEVLTLQGKDGREFPGLRKCQDAARTLQSHLAEGTFELDEQTSAKVHSIKTLLLMAKSGKDIGEEESAVAYEEIGGQFGASLVLAIERGLIVLPGELPIESRHGVARAQSETGMEETPTKQAAQGEAAPDHQTVTPGSACFKDSVPTMELAGEPPSSSAGHVEEVPPSALAPKSGGLDEGSFRAPSEQTAQTIALELLASELEVNNVQAHKLAWLALSEQRLSAAYQLATCLERIYPSSPASLPSCTVRALAIGIEIRQAHGHLERQLKADFGFVGSFVHHSAAEAFAQRLISVSAALCPAISAPNSGGVNVLRSGLPKLVGLKSLYSACSVIADYGTAQFELDPAALEYAENSDSWNQQLNSLQDEIQDWSDKARATQIRFAPAAKVWRKWLDRGGILFSLLAQIHNNDPSTVTDTAQIVSRLANENKIRTEVNATDRQLKGTALSGEINAVALAVIQRHTKEAVDFARRWMSLQEHRPSGKVDYRLSKLVEVRNAVDRLQGEVQEELDESFRSTDDIRIRAAFNCCRLAFNRLSSLLHPTPEPRRSDPELKYVLSSEFLLMPGLGVSRDNWEPLLEERALFRRLVESLAGSKSYDWEEAFQENSRKWRDHEATGRIIEYLNWTGQKRELVQRLINEQKSQIHVCQQTLERHVEECRKKIEIGVSRGLVRDKERSEFLQLVERIAERISITRNFREAEGQLDSIVSAINDAKTTLVKQVQQSMMARGIQLNDANFNRINGILETGDIDTATEYIEIVGRGGSLPDAETPENSFDRFFPSACSAIEEFLNDPRLSGSLLSRLENQKGLPSVEMGHLSDSKAREAVAMVEAWLSLKKLKRANQEQLKVLFECLGFEVLSISEGAGQPRAWVSLATKPLSHRDQCPLPYFGSSANGRYRVLCIWDHPSEEEIITLIRPGRLGDAPIVLYFDRFGELKRRNLASLCRAEHLTFLFIDEIILLFLCGEAKARLPVLFSCALPFTYANPYTTTSSLVPPEMFYGRRYERSQVIDPMGSCFVYGGRQLGKTALLISIRDEFHDPSAGRIAVWFDLKAAGITQDELWANLAQAFVSVQTVDMDLERKRSDHAVIEQLQMWLEKDERRRILLLLDEADRFLESDSKDNFKRTSLLKGLMERTNRRFKVVFAGLHNVQRTVKQENQPLAHFGEPICIGPLLDGGEWKAAKALIEEPLRSMGLRFDSADLVTRILAQTNYYPSLIQLYCNQLFQHLNRNSPPVFDWRLTPPCVITAKHVEDAYTSRHLRSAIRERFELTLNLDLRYRIIALIIALYGQSEESPAFDSMSVADVRALAIDFWARGFHDARSEEDFRVLLEEMVGLGVLQEVNGRFALRTPNVKSLLGTQDEIESKLVQSAQEEPAPAFEAHVFRTSDQREFWKRNPLTTLQESSMRAERNAVTILFGTRAAGLDDLSVFLSRAFGSGFYFPVGKESADRDYFRARLLDIKDKLRTGTSLVLVNGCAWTQSWVEEAIEWVGKKTVSKFVNVTFVADPITSWSISQNYRRLDELQSERRLVVHSLQPWHDSVLWQWLGDCRIGTNATDEKDLIFQKTGNWPYLLMEFGKKATGDPRWKDILDELHNKLNDRASRAEFRELFGLTLPEPVKVLGEMAALGGKVSIADLVSLLDAIPQRTIEDVIRWADRLSLVRCSARGEWELDPIVVKLLPFED